MNNLRPIIFEREEARAAALIAHRFRDGRERTKAHAFREDRKRESFSFQKREASASDLKVLALKEPADEVFYKVCDGRGELQRDGRVEQEQLACFDDTAVRREARESEELELAPFGIEARVMQA